MSTGIKIGEVVCYQVLKFYLNGQKPEINFVNARSWMPGQYLYFQINGKPESTYMLFEQVAWKIKSLKP